MSNALIPALQRSLESAGWAALRFNSRGVGRSEGTFDDGFGETDDTRAALDFVRREVPAGRSALIGWSFGSIVALRAAAGDGALDACVGIAPPVSAGAAGIHLPELPPGDQVPARILLVTGSEDGFALPPDVRALGTRIGAEVTVLDGSGHFFEGHHDEVALAITVFLAR